ncbi:MAG: nucleotidyl transferase AbiEii/AbiGii toxin family protein [bacterium]|nr:nucleotidyl transferase AbiEii/AbiGii toxin family protein [bacterium]
MMIVPRAGDSLHKSWLYRLLTEIADDVFLASVLRFKGGTCAAMRGLVNRFSVDLDFDLVDESKQSQVSQHLEKIFQKLGLAIKDHSRKVPQYFLKYDNGENLRSTIQLDINTQPPKENQYEIVRLHDIDRVLHCHTVPTMVANKLVATVSRFQRRGVLVGRDVYDLHAFLLQGLPFSEEIIQERTGKSPKMFFRRLKKCIEKSLTQQIIDQDLNMLLSPKEFHLIRKFLKQELLRMVGEEMGRL